MDFAIVQGQDGVAEMSWSKNVDQSTSVFLSLNIKKGTMFNNVGFGLDLSDIKKVTNNNIDLIRQRYQQALQWMSNTGRVKNLNIIVERDTTEYNRINAKVEITQANNEVITYLEWRSIGGPSTSFVYP
jgi:hypothetical protein